ncbi:amidohydrolase [Microbacterium sp. TPD7012]|uniref:amidohydrolase n=1 Tax=Microbacterium sp. TPD7012 TaxID=2171975 RepID=UPI000D50E32A|nr:amidohydrolase [Microbacterium sp. TPD7012]PVE98606.1 amidohydrolase [Microbacterium sp. TPD7012]
MTTPLHADVCIVDGRVFDGRVGTADTAVAIRDGRILAIGSDAEIRALVGPETRVVDAAGGGILPGFVDAHIHAAFAGVERLSCDLTGAASVDDTLAMIARAAETTDTDWITGGGWSHELFPHPTRQMLDAIVPDRPVALSDAGHHTLWVNSLALQLAGVDRDTPAPPNGHIHHDDQGDPTGYLNETAAELVGRAIPAATDAEITAGLLNAQEFLWTLGITGWHEAILGDYNGKADCTEAYRSTIADGSLRSRTSGALWVRPGTTASEVPELVERFVALRTENAAAGFDTSTAKAMVDGVPHGETAALLEPYCSHAGSGELHIDAEALEALVVSLDAVGFAMHLHIMGDRGVRVALAAVEAARRANGTGQRHHFAHLSMVHPDDARRFGPLGITANIQGLWASNDPAVVPMIGEARMRAGYPFRSIADSGAALAMGSDWPVSPADPWLAIHVAVNRSLPGPDGQPSEPLDAAQRLTLTEALTAYTSGSAELVLGGGGLLRVGARADITVSSVDPFAIPAEALIGVSTAVTIVAGHVVHESA